MEFVCDHLHLRSQDPDGAAKFYCDNFGASIKSVNPLSTTKSIRLELNGQPLMTISGKASGENPLPGSTDPRYGLDHFGFTVDDLDAAAKVFRANHVHITCEPWTMPSGSRVAFIEAPDHVSIELLERRAT